jgi:hypothetical protein
MIEARAPDGGFVIDAAESWRAALLAASTGVTSLLAMLRHIVYEGLARGASGRPGSPFGFLSTPLAYSMPLQPTKTDSRRCDHSGLRALDHGRAAPSDDRPGRRLPASPFVS